MIFYNSGFIALAAGLSVGMGGLAAGYAIGIVGDYVSGDDENNSVFPY